MLEAVIFDMDGILINSEPFWQKAEKIVFKKLGINISNDMIWETYGMPSNEVIEHWYRYKPWNKYNPQQIKHEIFTMVENLIETQGYSMEGVDYILHFFKNKKLKIALASASPFGIIDAVLKKLNLKNYFELCHSGEIEEHGKPHPAVYLTTAKKLEISPLNCIVFEDSLVGLIAAKAARMKAVVIPVKKYINNNKFSIADVKLNSLKEFNEKHFEILNSMN